MTELSWLLDYKEMTLDGKPITTEDLILLLAEWSRRHPEDHHIENVIAYWAYGRDPMNPLESSRKK